MLTKIKAHKRPLDKWHDLYQKYYLTGFQSFSNLNDFQVDSIYTGNFPRLLKFINELQNSRFSSITSPLLKNMGKALEGKDQSFSGNFDSLVGEYEFVFKNGQTKKVCIDASDSSKLHSSNETLSKGHKGPITEWADFYFKSNYSPLESYPVNVHPLLNGSYPSAVHLPYLKNLRNSKKVYDFSAILRVWGGSNNTDGIEHNLRILEELNAVKTKKKLLIAVLAAGDKSSIRNRLEKQGILVSDKLLPLKKVWKIGAESKFSIQRLGVHYCMPWRFIDSLAAGTSVILDTEPKTTWPSKLQKGLHYESFDLDIGLERPVASEKEYAELSSKMDDFLNRPKLSETLAQESHTYFDKYGSPTEVARYVLNTVSKL